jgi:type IV pilus assembly protein PilA
MLMSLREKVGTRLRERAASESGFTLVELLVVMLILGILAAIAIPSFFNQTQKANDASAKSAAKTAQTAMETFRVDHGGTYAGADAPALQNIEPTLNGAALTVTGSGGAPAVPNGTGYRVSVNSPKTGNDFWIDVNGGTQQLRCTTPNTGGCPPAVAPATTGNWGQ